MCLQNIFKLTQILKLLLLDECQRGPNCQRCCCSRYHHSSHSTRCQYHQQSKTHDFSLIPIIYININYLKYFLTRDFISREFFRKNLVRVFFRLQQNIPLEYFVTYYSNFIKIILLSYFYFRNFKLLIRFTTLLIVNLLLFLLLISLLY